jgi:hypothetical protein
MSSHDERQPAQRRLRTNFVLYLYFVVSFLVAPAANAICLINVPGLTVSNSSANAGTYTAPITPSAQSVTITVSGTYFSALGGTCAIGLAFSRSTLPPLMSTAGSTTMQYNVQTLAGGGSSLVYIGATPALANVLQVSFNAALLGVNAPFSVDLNVYFILLPNSPQPAGSYSDALTLHLFDLQGAIMTDLSSRAFLVTGAVSKVCSIGGVSHPASDTATIPISSSGQVSTAPIFRSYAGVTCNILTSVQLTSQHGGVVNAAAVPSGFSKTIDYTAAATFSGASPTLNTATIPTASGPEAGAAILTSGATPNGTLSVSITPQLNALPLISGAYSDTLTITLTPQ